MMQQFTGPVDSELLKSLLSGLRNQKFIRAGKNDALNGDIAKDVLANVIGALFNIQNLGGDLDFLLKNYTHLDDAKNRVYYKGKFLIRTQNRNENMNVWFGFFDDQELASGEEDDRGWWEKVKDGNFYGNTIGLHSFKKTSGANVRVGIIQKVFL